jgi:flagellar export protein FliJ
MRSKRFDPIQEIAAQNANELSRAMAEAASRVADLERQLEQLERYRDEYAHQSVAAGASVDAVKLQNYRSFLERLGEALKQSTKTLEAARAEHERRRAQWSEKRLEADSLNRVVERCRTEERRAEEAREQREEDDTGRRIALRAAHERGS